jgi:hypothetical protein
MAQLKEDEWPSDRERTTEETQVELTERDVRGSAGEPDGGTRKTNRRADDDDLLNVDPDSATD